jgi:hypothetical protein
LGWKRSGWRSMPNVSGQRGQLIAEFRERSRAGRRMTALSWPHHWPPAGSRGPLVIAKLGRLARRVSFISALMDGDVDFVACDFLQTNRLTFHGHHEPAGNRECTYGAGEQDHSGRPALAPGTSRGSPSS